MVVRVVVRAVVLKAYKERESIPTLGPSLLNNLKVSWLKSDRKGFGKIEKSRWCRGARSLQGEDRFPAGPRARLRWFQSGRNRLGRMKKVCLLSNWRGGETVNSTCNSTYLLKLEVQRYDSTQHDALKALSHGANFLATCNAILPPCKLVPNV